MPVVKMQKMAIISHKSLQEDLLEFLQNEGVVEISPNDKTPDISHPAVAYEKSEVRFAIEFLLPEADKNAAKFLKNPGTPEEITRSAMRTDFMEIIGKCKQLEDTASALAGEKHSLAERKKQLAQWRHLPVKLSELETGATIVKLGIMPKNSFEKLKRDAEARTLNVQLHAIDEIGDNKLTMAIVWKNDLERYEQIAAKNGETGVQLPNIERTAAQELKRIEQEFRLIKGKETEVKQRKQRLAKALPDLIRLAQYLNWMDGKQSARAELSQTDQTVYLTGWMPAKQMIRLAKKLERKFPASSLLPIRAGKNEEPPMQIYNRDWMAPFEAVTRLYGLPSHGEMDPTIPLSPFFILYFGLCLTDAGYGLALAAIMLGLILKLGLERQEAKLIWLLFYGGIVTFLIGIPFGGWFGMTPDQVPPIFTYVNNAGELRFIGQVWMPTKDVDFFRNLTIALGIIQILFGITLSGIWKWIHGKRLAALLEDFSAHMLVLALIARYLVKVPFSGYLVLASLAIFVFGHGFGKWWLKPVTGVLGSISFAIGFMSNALSYLRILALGLATGALAFAVNQIAVVIHNLLPAFIGIPVLVIIVIIGHAVSIALNCLGSFVHSGRLQFIEFFGQFFRGGGREFNPFRKSISPLA